jgi:hypothetical protein
MKIGKKKLFAEKLECGMIKRSWMLIDYYAIKHVIKEKLDLTFELDSVERVTIDEIEMLQITLSEGVYPEGIFVNKIYLSTDHEIILKGDDDRCLIIEVDLMSDCEFKYSETDD